MRRRKSRSSLHGVYKFIMGNSLVLNSIINNANKKITAATGKQETEPFCMAGRAF